MLFFCNAPNLVAHKMDKLKKKAQHSISAPYHPATNRQAEEMVAETKRALFKHTEGTVQCRIARFLFRQHTTGKTPAKATFSRQITTPLDRMKEWPSSKKWEIPKDGVTTECSAGQPVYVKRVHGRPAWVPATILNQLGLRFFSN